MCHNIFVLDKLGWGGCLSTLRNFHGNVFKIILGPSLPDGHLLYVVLWTALGAQDLFGRQGQEVESIL